MPAVAASVDGKGSVTSYKDNDSKRVIIIGDNSSFTVDKTVPGSAALVYDKSMETTPYD